VRSRLSGFDVLINTARPTGHASLGTPSSHATATPASQRVCSLIETRHRASTSMYSLTFCVRFLLPERYQRKPAVQAAAVMLRTTPATANHRRASHAHFPYTARNFENATVTRQSAASSARRPHPAGRSHYVVISRDGRKLVTRVRVMLP